LVGALVTSVSSWCELSISDFVFRVSVQFFFIFDAFKDR
jgi:hypothetical protein